MAAENYPRKEDLINIVSDDCALIQPDFEDILKLSNNLKLDFLKIFKGIWVVMDLNLKDNMFYCAVSPEIYKQLKEIENEKN